MGYGAIIIYGHPNYYPRFGFAPASQYHLFTKENHQFDAFMAMELIPGYLNEIKGKFYESEILDEDKFKKQIIQFDQKFKD